MKTNLLVRSGTRQRGFSLIELMIASTIGFIVLGGIGYLYLESRQAFRSMDSLSRMQESARYALEVMARDVRMAGYRGCASSNVAVTNVLNSKTTTAYNFDVPVNGYDAAGAGWAPALPSDTGGVSLLSIVAGTDAIILRGAYGGGATVTSHNPTAASLKVTEPNDIIENDILMVTDCTAASVFQVSNHNPASAFNVVHNEGATATPGNLTKDLGRKYENGEVIKMQTKTYFIRNGANGRPALWQFDNHKAAGGDNPSEIADGIRNMQIKYGSDADSDGAVESYTNADTVADWKKVAAVRISLLVAGNEDNVATAKQTLNYDGAPYTAGDLRLYQVFTTTITMRNKTQ